MPWLTLISLSNSLSLLLYILRKPTVYKKGCCMLAELALRGTMYGALGESLADVAARALRDGARAYNRNLKKPNKEIVSKNPEVGKEVKLAA